MGDYAGIKKIRQRLKLRPALLMLLLACATLPTMPLQLVMIRLWPNGSRLYPLVWHSAVCRIFGITVDIQGTRLNNQSCLFVSNHLSWLDIMVLGSRIPGSFIAKAEVAGWGVFGWLAKLQRTVFVDRTKRSDSARQRDALKRRFKQGDQMILFPEGTSTDGTWVKPFKSALFSVVETNHGQDDQPILVQPVTISYTHVNGLPFTRSQRPRIAWFGDMELTSHIWQALEIGKIKAVIQFHEPMSPAQYASRKELAQACHAAVSSGLIAANTGRLPIAGRADDPAIAA